MNVRFAHGSGTESSKLWQINTETAGVLTAIVCSQVIQGKRHPEGNETVKFRLVVGENFLGKLVYPKVPNFIAPRDQVC